MTRKRGMAFVERPGVVEAAPLPAARNLREGIGATSDARRSANSLMEKEKWARSSAVEHLTFNQVVVGSIPTGLTSIINMLCATRGTLRHTLGTGT